MLLPYGSDISAVVRRAEGATRAERREWIVGRMMETFQMPEDIAVEVFGMWLRSHREEDVVVARPVLVARKRRAR